jgi:hypothetical protein
MAVGNHDPKTVLIFELLHELQQSKNYLENLKLEIAHVKKVIKYTKLSIKAGERIYPEDKPILTTSKTEK